MRISRPLDKRRCGSGQTKAAYRYEGGGVERKPDLVFQKRCTPPTLVDMLFLPTIDLTDPWRCARSGNKVLRLVARCIYPCRPGQNKAAHQSRELGSRPDFQKTMHTSQPWSCSIFARQALTTYKYALTSRTRTHIQTISAGVGVDETKAAHVTAPAAKRPAAPSYLGNSGLLAGCWESTAYFSILQC
ncbi:hypothetical protein BDY17DRAFT_175604 [Neohortaea acidophila]|uniref:Uncharacterized protein n=1 Tax=Neohortaea acidophila TaxID=245834 RepID=A0A6A6PQT9_9PEZI|nr:uncharacterized protein BDY17DRAFT_175604 [Neohortaea acidophila]KAF2481994.1 hypothetical protein BDY17DRAFT_175604 [Neohortaea acidophila]